MGRESQIVAIIVAIYLAFSILLPIHRFNFDHLSRFEQALLIVIPTAVFMLLQLSLSLSIIKCALTNKWQVIVAIVGLVVWFGILLLRPSRSFGVEEFLLFYLTKQALLGLCLTFSLTNFGSLLSLIIKDKNLLLPVALIAMPIDFVGAMTSAGFTHDLVAHAPKFVSSVSVSVPAVTSVSSHGISIGPIAFIGPGDVLFMALFFATVQRFNLAERATFWWMYALLTVSMILVVQLPNFAVGALVPMGIGVIIANSGKIRLKRDELFAVVYASALVLVIVGFFFWSSHRYLFHSH
jgi:hypothetical protein